VIIDTSALLAVLFAEPEREAILEAMMTASDLRISAATYVEAGVVVDGRKEPVLSRDLDDLVATLSIAIAPLTEDQARIARQAYRDFGRGSGHPARLNYGDCMSYALAKDSREPLLWKGDDFGHTDVRRA
jgi:ribonuclease VapC